MPPYLPSSIFYLLLLGLWLPVVYLLGAQWSVYEQYHYGWAVPFMCLFFAWERSKIWRSKTGDGRGEGKGGGGEEGRSKIGDNEAKGEGQRVGSVGDAPVSFDVASKELEAVQEGNQTGQGRTPHPGPLPDHGGEGKSDPKSEIRNPKSELQSSISELRTATAELPTPPSALRPPNSSISIFGFLLFALLYGFTRFLHEANPLWRLTSYALALEVGAITLLWVYFAGGWSRVKWLAFPVAFFLIAIPWPSPVEQFVIQNLTQLNTAMVIELLNFFGVPALAHGNVIEISTGVVGIDEACSGIRSFQATLMLSLFFGEFYRLRVARRFGLVFAGVIFAMISNLCRTYFLVWIAARDGVAAIDKWHDSAGVFVLTVCFLGTWLMAVAMQRGGIGDRRWEMGDGRAEGKGGEEGRSEIGDNEAKGGGRRVGGAGDSSETVEERNQTGQSRASHSDSLPGRSGGTASPVFCHPFSKAAFRFLVFVFCFFVLVEVSVELWFRLRESRVGGAQWVAEWPQEWPDYQERPLGVTVKNTLKYDYESAASWTDDNGNFWQGIYLRWNAGENFYSRARAALAKGHRPEACLPAAGLTLESELPPGRVEVNGMTFAFRRYVFESQGRHMHVFFLMAGDDAQMDPSQYLSLDRSLRFKAALAGRRGGGHTNLEVAVVGFDTPEAAWAAFVSELPKWVREGKIAEREG